MSLDAIETSLIEAKNAMIEGDHDTAFELISEADQEIAPTQGQVGFSLAELSNHIVNALYSFGECDLTPEDIEYINICLDDALEEVKLNKTWEMEGLYNQ